MQKTPVLVVVAVVELQAVTAVQVRVRVRLQAARINNHKFQQSIGACIRQIKSHSQQHSLIMANINLLRNQANSSQRCCQMK